ncbi:MAG: glycine C-acetyltransferase [Clostridiales Family XIII bacterium]|jgi:glycine C-acetyltransferase|nr:glycine C-acetyltransferase [Clostridiales Family XIII bacterium]
MNKKEALSLFARRVSEAKSAGTYKTERTLTGPQRGRVDTAEGKDLINMCSNNYLGLCDDEVIIKAAKKSFEKWGYGLSSVRFICGTAAVHKELEGKLSAFLGMEDTILYSSCFDANGGLFETLLDSEDAVISDALNHASIIDGIRLCRAKRYRYANNDMADLERQLKEADDEGARIKLIATDGVFSMDGIVANLADICDLAERYGALTMTDDSHAVGFMGENGRGVHEYRGVMGRIDIITGTLGKALGGASGGYTSARKEIVDLLRQNSRPYLFSNTLAPSIAEASLKALDILASSDDKRRTLWDNTAYFRAEIAKAGFDIIAGVHPITAIMLYDAKLAGNMAARLSELGVYVTAFSYPVVPADKARIRVQVSAAHTKKDLDTAIAAFVQAKRELA